MKTDSSKELSGATESHDGKNIIPKKSGKSKKKKALDVSPAINQSSGKRRKSAEEEGGVNCAMGPGGEFVDFPEYSGDEEPRKSMEAFTLFCKATRKVVKKSLGPSSRKNKGHVSSILKDNWCALTGDEKHVWKEWEVWDAKRCDHQSALYEKRRCRKKARNSSPRLVMYDHHERQWNSMFDKLVGYKRVHGETNVPQR